ncbi:hypothetical protein [Halostagnicola sp. A-GB9-2]|uniref:hypothetical protein n=1 Tax=Halostagnicola sp. A-GB9-2 TaxID=3048066 RepID=UPI0024C09315|nr:hypothetical protein [Halostagnicola sp. A-GB9-2]MDJ1433542.1 hypothetical protein [Halostagnicola sp. A-GB9-2]
MSDSALERLRFAHDNNPNAGAKRLLWLADADPSYLEAAEAIVAGESVDNIDQEPGHRRNPSVSTDPEACWSNWADADFATPASNIWPDELLEREQWMGHVDKKLFAPWADRDHPEAGVRDDDEWNRDG